MLHGLDGSSKSLIISGSNAIPFQLVDTGKYDVWLLNSRGNHHSRKHLWLDPDTQPEFWDFSFEEMGGLDLLATVQFI
jgi:lysosomal acid lipase/cholesteryl ester hydrolase